MMDLQTALHLSNFYAVGRILIILITVSELLGNILNLSLVHPAVQMKYIINIKWFCHTLFEQRSMIV